MTTYRLCAQLTEDISANRALNNSAQGKIVGARGRRIRRGKIGGKLTGNAEQKDTFKRKISKLWITKKLKGIFDSAKS